MKRKLTLCLILAALLTVLCVSHVSASAAGTISWSIENGVLTITGTGCANTHKRVLKQK